MKFGTSAFAGLAHLGPAYGRENYSTTYAEMDGELVFALDRGRRSFRLDSMPKSSAKAEQLMGEYGDCSTATLVCFDFAEFMQAVPRADSRATWSEGQWRFRRSVCLSGPENVCRRYAVIFSNDAGGYDGGFVFSKQIGVELFYHSNRASKRKPLVYVLQEGEGLLSGGRP